MGGGQSKTQPAFVPRPSSVPWTQKDDIDETSTVLQKLPSTNPLLKRPPQNVPNVDSREVPMSMQGNFSVSDNNSASGKNKTSLWPSRAVVDTDSVANKTSTVLEEEEDTHGPVSPPRVPSSRPHSQPQSARGVRTTSPTPQEEAAVAMALAMAASAASRESQSRSQVSRESQRQSTPAKATPASDRFLPPSERFVPPGDMIEPAARPIDPSAFAISAFTASPAPSSMSPPPSLSSDLITPPPPLPTSPTRSWPFATTQPAFSPADTLARSQKGGPVSSLDGPLQPPLRSTMAARHTHTTSSGTSSLQANASGMAQTKTLPLTPPSSASASSSSLTFQHLPPVPGAKPAPAAYVNDLNSRSFPPPRLSPPDSDATFSFDATEAYRRLVTPPSPERDSLRNAVSSLSRVYASQPPSKKPATTPTPSPPVEKDRKLKAQAQGNGRMAPPSPSLSAADHDHLELDRVLSDLSGTDSFDPREAFVSFVRRDHAFVGRICSDLSKRGISCRLFEVQEEQSPVYMDKVSAALRSAGVVIFCFSPDSLRSQCFLDHIGSADEVGREFIGLFLSAPGEGDMDVTKRSVRRNVPLAALLRKSPTAVFTRDADYPRALDSLARLLKSKMRASREGKRSSTADTLSDIQGNGNGNGYGYSKQKNLGQGQGQGQGPAQVRKASEREEVAEQEMAAPVNLEDFEVLVVDAKNGPYRSLREAIWSAQPGARIVMRPGVYEESNEITKEVHIRGGPSASEKHNAGRSSASPPPAEDSEVIIRTVGREVLIVSARASIRNLTLQATEGTSACVTVISGGSLELEDCVLQARISDEAAHVDTACVQAVGTGASLFLRRCRIADCSGAGIRVDDNATAVIEENEVQHVLGIGIGVSSTASGIVMRRNFVHDGLSAGIALTHKCTPLLVDNDIARNITGIEIGNGANPIVKGNKIHGNGDPAGVYVHSGGLGCIVQNRISRNDGCQVRISSGSNPTVCGNAIVGSRKNASAAIMVTEGGGGLVIHNRISSSEGSDMEGVHAVKDCDALVRDNGPDVQDVEVLIVDKRWPATKRERIGSSGMTGLSSSVVSAVADARNAAYVIVRPGVYEGSVEVQKEVHIVGSGVLTDVHIVGTSGPALVSTAASASLLNLTLRAPNEVLLINHGSISVEEVDMCPIGNGNGSPSQSKGVATAAALSVSSTASSSSLWTGAPCVTIRNGANPTLRFCSIHNAIGSGVFVDGGRGVLDGCDIYGNASAGIEVRRRAAPVIRDCSIHHNKWVGVWILEESKGQVLDSEIYENDETGVVIKESSSPLIKNNKIRSGLSTGVLVFEDGVGVIEDNEIYGNQRAGIEVRSRGNPTVRRNKVYDNRHYNVWVYKEGHGIFEENTIFSDGKGGLFVGQDGSSPVLLQNNISQQSQSQSSTPTPPPH